MADFGLKVSLPGKDISSTNPEDFVFNSGNVNNVKILSQNSITVTVAASSSTDVTIEHGLGFIPMIMLFTEITPGSGKWYMGIPLYGAGDVYINSDPSYTYVDDTNFKYRLTNTIAAQRTVLQYIFVFGDAAN